MEAGAIFYWTEFPLQADRELKNRFFLHLGSSSVLDTPIIINLVTATSQIDFYKPGQKREKNQIFRVDLKKYVFFTTDCLLDLSMGHQPVEQDTFDAAVEEGKIIQVGKFEGHDLSLIFNKLVAGGNVSPKHLREIRNKLEGIGCKNLCSVKGNK